MENYKNPITTQENINELHHILVQTCLDYMVEHGLTDIDEIDNLSFAEVDLKIDTVNTSEGNIFLCRFHHR